MARSQAEAAAEALRRHLQRKKEAEGDQKGGAAAARRPGSALSRFAWRRAWWRPLVLSACVVAAAVLAFLNWTRGQNQGWLPLAMTIAGVLLVLVAVVGIWRRPPGSVPSLRARLARLLDR